MWTGQIPSHAHVSLDSQETFVKQVRISCTHFFEGEEGGRAIGTMEGMMWMGQMPSLSHVSLASQEILVRQVRISSIHALERERRRKRRLKCEGRVNVDGANTFTISSIHFFEGKGGRRRAM